MARRAALASISGAGLIAIAGLVAWLAGASRILAAAQPVAGDAAAARPRALRTPQPLPLPADLHVPSYTPGHNPFRDGETLAYAASWIGVPAATARIVIVHNRTHPDWWSGQMWLQTSAVADVAYRMRDYFREDFDYAALRPDNIYILQHENQRRDEWRVKFDRAARLVVAIKTSRHGKVTTRRFSGGDPLGPFSGAMMALSQPLKPGDKLPFDVFSGGNRYVFSFNVTGRERITTALGTFDTLKIEPWVLWLSQGSFRTQARATTLWVTDDDRHLPVRVEADAFIGHVRADLISFSGAPGGAGRSAGATPAAPSDTPGADGADAPGGPDQGAP
ncbi:MAG: DUF3108 domain-containing protein [Candidatus Binataceae bacterium]|nr:DUF3108 domain-containing protein [Candidatus Binataceae bacterium]